MATAAPAMVLAGTTSRGEEGLAEFPERAPPPAAATVFADGVGDCDTVHEPDGVADRVPDVEPDVEDAPLDVGAGVGAIRDLDPDP
jgi:hypothetical protein